VEIAYFFQTEGLSLEHTISVAQDVSAFGISIADLVDRPEDMRLSESELQYLSRFFQQEAVSANSWQTLRLRLRQQRELGHPDVRLSVERLLPRGGNPIQGRPLGLDSLQGTLLSQDFDDAAPYFHRLSPLQMFKAPAIASLEALSEWLRLRDQSIPQSLSNALQA
jgi:hypothetical protein